MVSKIGIQMSTNGIHLSNSKCSIHFQKQELLILVHQNSFRRKNVKISNINFAIFLGQNVVIASLSTLESTFLVETIRYAAPRCSSQKMQNLVFENFKCVTCSQPIWVLLSLI